MSTQQTRIQELRTVQVQLRLCFLGSLASAYCRAEDIRIGAVVISELKLRNVQPIYLALTLWNVPTTPRLKIDQKPSIVFVWIAPTTY